MKGYSVSIFYRKIVIGVSQATTQERLWAKVYYDVANKEEALGKAVIESSEQLKGFDMSMHLIIEFEIKKDEENEK